MPVDVRLLMLRWGLDPDVCAVNGTHDTRETPPLKNELQSAMVQYSTRKKLVYSGSPQTYKHNVLGCVMFHHKEPYM